MFSGGSRQDSSSNQVRLCLFQGFCLAYSYRSITWVKWYCESQHEENSRLQGSLLRRSYSDLWLASILSSQNMTSILLGKRCWRMLSLNCLRYMTLLPEKAGESRARSLD
jgi:hypothetical protein